MKNGEVVEFEDEKLEELKRRIAADLGFRIVGERLELYCVPIGDEEDPEK